jgi:hypothetical protein
MTKTGLKEAGIFYTILTVLEMIFLKVLGSEGEDDLGNGSSSSRRGRQIFRGNR